MTPPAVQVQFYLSQRYAWFQSWLFKWHHIGGDGIEIEMFDDRPAQLGGIAFFGSARRTYWDALVRGVRKEVVERLAWIDGEVRRYNEKTAEAAVDECVGLLAAFVRKVRRSAVETDRILRGNGFKFPPLDDAGQWDGLSAEELTLLGEGLKASLPPANHADASNVAAARPTIFAEALSLAREIDTPDERLQFWLDHQGDLARRELLSEIASINAKMNRRGIFHSSIRIGGITAAAAQLIARCTQAALAKAEVETAVVHRCELVTDSLFKLVEYVRERVSAEISKSWPTGHSRMVGQAGPIRVDQIALDLAAAIRLARPALTSPKQTGPTSGSDKKPKAGRKLKPGPRPDPDWEWAIGAVTSDAIRAGYSKPLVRGIRAAIETMLLERMAERDKHFTEGSARKYATRVIDALPDRAA